MIEFRASRPLRFEDTKRIRSPEMKPEKFRDFRETGAWTERMPDSVKLFLILVELYCYFVTFSLVFLRTIVLFPQV